MTPTEEKEMHKLATDLMELTRGTGWEAAKYVAVAKIMGRLTEYCATCECEERRNMQRAPRLPSQSPYRR